MGFDDLKIDVKNVLASEDSEEIKDSCLFLYGNNEINWFATDYLMSDSVPDGSKQGTKGMIRYFLEYLEDYERWKHNDITGKSVPLGLVTDEHFFDFVRYIEDDIGLNRNAIARRIKAALHLIKFVQDTYNLDYRLITISSDGEFFEDGLVHAYWLINPFTKQRYLHHKSIPNEEEYSSRDPITEAAIESLYDDLDKLEESGKEYKVELLTTCIGLLEATGVRVSEAANIDDHTIKLLQLQLKSYFDGKPIDLAELIESNRLTMDKKSLQAAEAIYRKSQIVKGGHNHVWIKIKTTKGKNKDKIRIVPIPITTAQSLVRFYNDYIVNELDRVNTGKPILNRKKHKKLFIQPETHEPMSGPMLSHLFYDVFNRQYKNSKHKRFPHLFRHRFISLLVFQQFKSLKSNLGGQHLASLILRRIQGLTGHVSIETMLHYVELAEADFYDLDNEVEQEPDISALYEAIAERYGEDEAAKIKAVATQKKREKAKIIGKPEQ